MSKVIKKIGKILIHSFAGVVLVAILLILAAALALSLPRVQSFVAIKAVDLFSHKTDTHIAIEAISIENLSRIQVEGLYVEDLRGDTLLWADKLSATLNRDVLLTEGRLIPSDVRLRKGFFNMDYNAEGSLNLDELILHFTTLFPADTTTESAPFVLEGVDVEDLRYRLHDASLAGGVPEGSIDYSDMDMMVSKTLIRQIKVVDGVVGLYGVTKLSTVDKSGALLQNSSFGKLEISEGELHFEDIDFTSEGTHLLLPLLNIKGPSWKSYKNFCDLVTLTLKTNGSTLEPTSAGRFVAALGDIAIEGEEITGTFVGTVNDFGVDISATLYDSDVVVVGEVENITRIEALAAKADLDITTTPAKVDNIYRNITHTPLPAEAKEWTERFTTLALSGNAAIRPREVVADAELSTDLGSVAVDGTLHYAPSGFSFEGLIAGDALEAGKILKTEQLGKADLTLKGAVEMTGGELEGDLTADVERIWWSGYDYNNLSIEGSLKDENFRATATSADPNIAFALEADGSINKQSPEYNLILSLDRADLGMLGLTSGEGSSWLAGSVEATLEGRSLDDMVGRAMINNLTYGTDKETFSTELVNISLRGGEQDKSFSLRSNIADVEYRSTASYGDVLDYLTKRLPTLLPWAKPTTKESTPSESKLASPLGERLYAADDYTSVNLKIFDSQSLISTLIPEANISSGSSFSMEFSPAGEEFVLHIESNLLETKDMTISGLDIEATGHGPEMSLKAESSEFRAMGLIIPDITLQANSNQSHEVDANFYFSNTDTAVSGQIGAHATLSHDDKGALAISAKLFDSYLISPELRWTIGADRIDYSSEGVTIDNFVADTGTSAIEINGAIGKHDNTPLRLSLREVSINEWVALLGSMDDIKGHIDGQVELYSALEQPYGTGELKLSSLSMGEINIDPMLFNISIPKRSTTASAWLKNTTSGNTIARGKYNYTSGVYEAKLAVEDFHFSLLEPMLKGVAHQIEGLGDIDVELSGSGQRDLNINGTVEASALKATIDYTGARYTIPTLRLNFDKNKGVVVPFRIEDKEGGWASAEATIDLKRLGNITYDASIEPHNLIAIDLPKETKTPFYGKVYLGDGGVRLSGGGGETTISGGINTGGGSVFSIPLKGNNDFAGADFVTFVEFDQESNNLTNGTSAEVSKRENSAASNLTIDMMLGVDTNTLLRLIIDPETENVIEARGNANLGVTLDARKNDFAIRGDYQITEGVYNFNFQNIITKNFDINPGSYIRWNGSPLDANIDVAATYKLKTSLAPLLGTESTASRASTPVECIVKLTGSLAKVDVSFDINVPTANTEYQTILSSYFSSQEMMATQFVYLLALGNFYSDSSTGQTTTAGVAGTAIGLDFLASQVSRLVSNDTYKFNLKYKSIDDTSSSYSIDFQTEIIDDRLSIELEANVDTGDYFETIGNNNNQISGGGSITLRLDPSGSVYLKGFSRTIDRFDENQGLQENGLGLYFQRSFNRFSDLMNKKREKAAMENEEKSGNFAPTEENDSEKSNENEEQ